MKENDYQVEYSLDEYVEHLQSAFPNAQDIKYHVTAAAKILGIHVPPIKFVPHLVMHNGMNYTLCGPLTPVLYAQGYLPCTAFYSQDTQSILVSLYDISEAPYSIPTLLFVLLHELYHSFQFATDPDTFAHNASICEYADDIAEIDADAFAAAYLEKCSSYRPHYYGDIKANFNLNNKRAKRTKELKREYFSPQKKVA